MEQRRAKQQQRQRQEGIEKKETSSLKAALSLKAQGSNVCAEPAVENDVLDKSQTINNNQSTSNNINVGAPLHSNNTSSIPNNALSNNVSATSRPKLKLAPRTKPIPQLDIDSRFKEKENKLVESESVGEAGSGKGKMTGKDPSPYQKSFHKDSARGARKQSFSSSVSSSNQNLDDESYHRHNNATKTDILKVEKILVRPKDKKSPIPSKENSKQILTKDDNVVDDDGNNIGEVDRKNCKIDVSNNNDIEPLLPSLSEDSQQKQLDDVLTSRITVTKDQEDTTDGDIVKKDDICDANCASQSSDEHVEIRDFEDVIVNSDHSSCNEKADGESEEEHGDNNIKPNYLSNESKKKDRSQKKHTSKRSRKESQANRNTYESDKDTITNAHEKSKENNTKNINLEFELARCR